MRLRAALRVLAVLTVWVAAAAPAMAAPGGSMEIVDTTVDRRDIRMVITGPRALGDEDLSTEIAVHEGRTEIAADVERVAAADQEIVLVIDTSGSMDGAAMTAAKEAAASFTRQLPSGVRVSVVGFGDKPSVASNFAGGPAGAVRAIETLDATGETALYDAVELAIAQLSDAPGTSRTIVLLSDGADTVSDSSLIGALDAVASSGAGFLAIRLNTTDSDFEPLLRLAEAGNGEVFGADDPGLLNLMYDEVALALHNQYTVSYTSEGAGRTDVRVSVPRWPSVGSDRTAISLPPAPPPAARPSPAPQPEPAPPQRVELSGLLAVLTSPWVLPVGAMLIFLAATILLVPILGRRPANQRRRGSGAVLGLSAARSHHLGEAGDWAKTRVDDALRRRGAMQRINGRLEQAGILLRPAEYVLAVAGVAVALFIVGAVAQGPLTGLVLAVATVPGARAFLSIKADRRRKEFTAQLGDTLQVLAGSLRSGYGILQAADAVAREADPPTSDEFRRLVMETRLGRDIEDTLRAMAGRVGSEDFTWVMQAIEIHREVGGDLSIVLDEVSSTIREREQVFRQVKALSAEGRLSAIILIALPFVVVGGISISNPGYMDELYTTSVGRVLMMVGTGLLAIGAFWISRVVKPKF